MPRPPWSEDPIVEWDDENIVHVARHGVTSAEVDIVFELGEYSVSPHKKRRKASKYSRRYVVKGQTLGGRELLIIVDRLSVERIRPVTAWPE